jgi:xanthine permease XanP
MAQAEHERLLDPDLDRNLENDSVQINADLLYGLNDRPPIGESILVAIQHVLASFVGIITPALLICSALNL